MSPANAAFDVLAFCGFLGLLYWSGRAVVWVYRLYTRPEILPEPYDDERDTIAAFHRVIERELS